MSGDDAWKRILVGGVLVLLSPLVIPALLLFGYYTRVLRSTAMDPATVPRFSQWWDLFTDGLGFAAIAIVYGIVPGAIVAAGGYVGAPGIATLGGLLALAVYYVLPAGLANYARTDELTGAFRPGPLGDMVLDSQYAVGWLGALAVLIVGGLLASVLTVAIVGVFVAFYVNVAAFHIYGEATAAAHGRGSDAPVGEEPATA